MKTALLLSTLFFAPLGHAEQYLDLPTELPSRYGVIGLRAVTIGPDSLVVERVQLYSPAHRGGIQKGDRIIAIPPYRIRTPDEMSRCVQSYAPGDTLLLVLRRDGKKLKLSCGVSDIKHLYYLMDEEGAPISPEKSLQAIAKKVPVDEKTAYDLISQQGATAEFTSLQRALALDVGRYGSDCRLQTINKALHNPLTTGRIAGALTDAFAANTSLADHLQTAARYLDIDLTTAFQAPVESDHPVLPFVLSPLISAIEMTDRAFAALNDAERADLPSAIPNLLKRFGDTFLLDTGDSTETVGHIQTLRLAKRIDLKALFVGALQLAHLADPDVLKAMRRNLQNLNLAAIDSLPPGVSGDFLYAEHTSLGWVLIGDRGPNFYDTDAVAIFDLGGDDIYFSSHLTPTQPTLIIDYDGDDRYLGGHIATGIGSISLLVDLKGNDLYQSSDLGLGAAFCGIGMLWDHSGDDHYLGAQASQGAAFFGAGLLVDDTGDDLYTAELFAQGFGGMRGLGLLYDLTGDDRYLVDGKVPSPYSIPNTYAGWAQGAGCGFRGYGSGGIGLLLDGSGEDYYQGGDFAQGVGYFFALGVLGDLQGNDQYQGSRYAQGAAAHQAVGALLERAGNDRYEAKIAASQGAGWDAAIGYLADLGGDDRYEALHLSQGAAAMNGLGLLYDGDGRDYYETDTGQGQGSSTTYWGGRNALNFGLLIDLGGDADNYSLRKNQADTRDTGIGLFADR